MAPTIKKNERFLLHKLIRLPFSVFCFRTFQGHHRQFHQQFTVASVDRLRNPETDPALAYGTSLSQRGCGRRFPAQSERHSPQYSVLTTLVKMRPVPQSPATPSTRDLLEVSGRKKVTFQPSGSRIRKNSEIAHFYAKWSEFLRIRLQIVAYTTWLKCY